MTRWIGRLEDARTVTWLASLLGVLLIVAAFGMTVTRAVEMDFFNRQPFWVADAIPAVISELYYGHKKRYTTLESVQRRFFARVDREVATARQINAAMRRLEETSNENPGTAYLLLGPDDKGIVDLIEGGFLLFGLRAESIVTFYFTLLLLSCILYVVAYWRSPTALLLLVAFLGMFYLVMPMIMHNGQLRSILALRVLPILSMVACLHVLLFMANSLHARVRAGQIVLVAIQVLLVTFAIHLRSTTLWQVATILGFGMTVLVAPGIWRGIGTRLAGRGRPEAKVERLATERSVRFGASVGQNEAESGGRLGLGPDGVVSRKPAPTPGTQVGAGFQHPIPSSPNPNLPASPQHPIPSSPNPNLPASPAQPTRPHHPSPSRSSLLAVVVAIGLTVAGYLGLQAYHAVVLPEEYRRGDEIATRVFWHNIFTGFAYHPSLQARFEVWLDDVSIIAATGRYLVETDQPDRWLEMGGRLPVPGASDGAAAFEGIKFAKYDPVVREMLIARCTTFVRECLETFVWYKPISLAENLAWLYGFRALPPNLDVAESPYFGDILKRQFLGTSEGLDANGTRAYLWTPRVLLIVVPFVVLLLLETRQRTGAAFSAYIGLGLGSMIPTVAGYAAPHTISEPAIVAGMLVYLGACVVLAAGLRRLVAREEASTPQPSLPEAGAGEAGQPAPATR